MGGPAVWRYYPVEGPYSRRCTWPGRGEAIDLSRAALAAALKHASATLLTECLVMEATATRPAMTPEGCGMTLATAERTFDRATRDDAPSWLAYFDEAYLAARMAQCFRDPWWAGHTARVCARSLDMDGRYVAVFYTKVYDRLLVPLTAANQPQVPPELRATLAAITRHVDDYANRARLPRGA